MDINVVQVCEIIEKISMGLKYVSLMMPLSKYVFIFSSLFLYHELCHFRDR